MGVRLSDIVLDQRFLPAFCPDSVALLLGGNGALETSSLCAVNGFVLEVNHFGADRLTLDHGL